MDGWLAFWTDTGTRRESKRFNDGKVHPGAKEEEIKD